MHCTQNNYHAAAKIPGTFTLRKLVFHFLSNWMGYDRGDSFPFDFEPNGFSFGSKSKWKLSPRSYHIQFERKWNTSFLSVEKKAASLIHLRSDEECGECNHRCAARHQDGQVQYIVRIDDFPHKSWSVEMRAAKPIQGTFN